MACARPTGGRDGQVENYAEDTPEKREQLIGWLNDADILVLSSNRLWGSIPRLPMRFPMTKEYYDLLFDGKLGFELAGRFTSFPTIFGIPIRRHRRGRSVQRLRPSRGADLPQDARVQRGAGAELLRPDRPGEHDPDVAEAGDRGADRAAADRQRVRHPAGWAARGRHIFNLDALVNRSPVVSALVWLVLVILLGLAAFPITFVVLRRLPDRGYGVSKTLGMLLLAWLAWFAPALKLTAYTRPWIALCLGLMFGFAAARRLAPPGGNPGVRGRA